MSRLECGCLLDSQHTARLEICDKHMQEFADKINPYVCPKTPYPGPLTTIEEVVKAAEMEGWIVELSDD